MTDDAAFAIRFSSGHANSLINRLPTELITMILQFAVLRGPRTSFQSESLYKGGGLNYYKELSLIQRVCKKWHDIVEANSSFWYSISTLFPPRLLRKIIERAPGGKSLFVEYSASTLFGWEKERLLAFGPEILRLSESWTCLHVQSADSSQLLQVLARPVPHLRKLHVEHSGKRGTFEGMETSFRSVSLPIDILKVKDSIFPPWKWNTISDLLEIEVDCCHLCPYFSQGFIDVLRSSPRLTSLRIGFCETNFRPQLQTSSITLQHLVSIDIKYSSPAAALLKAITCPPSTKISICDKTRSLTIQDPWVVAAFDHTNFECTDRVCLHLGPNSVVGAVVGNIDLEMGPEEEPYQLAAMRLFFLDFLRPFSETNGAQVATLKLDLDLAYDAAPFINMLDYFFPNITSLEVRCHFYWEDHDISSSLSDTLAQPFIEEDGKRRWILPRIEKLAIDWNYSYPPLAKCIIDAIRSRCSLQEPTGTIEAHVGPPPPTRLRELYIGKCEIFLEDFEELQNLFGRTVKFDDIWFRDPTVYDDD